MLSITFDETGEATRIVRTGMFVIIVFLGGFFGWSFVAPISGAVIADGIIKIDSKRKTIQHLEGGVVKEILVREGEYVEAGQLLLVLEDADVKSNLTILKDQLNAHLAKEARLVAEKKFIDAVVFPEELAGSDDLKVKEILRNEQSLFLAKKKSIDEEIAIIRNEINHAWQEEASIQAEIEAVGQNIRYKQERVAASEILSAKQFIEKNQFLQLKESLAEKQESLNNSKAKLASTRQRQAELDLRIIGLRNEFSKAADDELKETTKAIFEVQEKIRPAELALNRFRITAPIAGQVIDLKVSTIGGVVRSGDPLMDLVPNNQELVMEVKVKTKDIEQVHTGQRADVQLLAYSTRKVPHIDGHVVYVSGDALEDQSHPEAPFYFLAHIRVDRDALEGLPNVELSPGMPVVAYIQTRSRTFFDMLVKPFEDSVSRGLRNDT